MTQAERIISKFGGLSALAKALGHKHASTVQGWQERGFIPSARHAEVMKAGEQTGVPIEPADFFAASNDRAREAKSA